MARIIGGLTTSHVPMIGKAIAGKKQQEPYFKPFFDGFIPVHRWLAEAKPDVAVVIYNDHGLNFFLDKMPTFAIGAAHEYHNADEGWGAPMPHVFTGEPRLSWHIIDALVSDEFDLTTCQEMLFDHAGVTALDLLWPGHGPAPVKTVPIVINAVQPPLPTPKRCYKLGQALGRAIRSYPEDLKVLIIGSGGLSHQLGRLGFINEEFDRLCMDKIVSEPESLTRYSSDNIVDLAGSQGLEFMTWIAMRGAVSGTVEVVASTYHVPISHTGAAVMLLDARNSSAVAAAK
jgi:protocatechuate 4,5-dioxygenase beta chain